MKIRAVAPVGTSKCTKCTSIYSRLLDFGTVLFTLTGVHVTHTLTGVLTLGFVFFRIRNTTEIGDNQFAVEGAVKWWPFVDVAWVFIYPARYLLK